MRSRRLHLFYNWTILNNCFRFYNENCFDGTLFELKRNYSLYTSTFRKYRIKYHKLYIINSEIKKRWVYNFMKISFQNMSTVKNFIVVQG